MKVLVIQIRQLGDILLSSPLGRVIKESIKGVEVHFLTSEIGRDILTGNPFIDKILVIRNGIKSELKTIFQVKKEQYDAIIDVQRTGRSKRITLFSGAPLRIAFRKGKENFYYNKLIEQKNHGYTVWGRMELLKGLGIESPIKPFLPELYVSMKETKELKKLIPQENFVVLVPTARKLEKMWSLENFAMLIDFLKEDLNISSVVCYAPGEEKFIKKLQNFSKVGFSFPEKPLSIKELAFLIKKATLFIGNNSFASHVAVSQRTKTIVIDKRKSEWFPPVPFVKEVYSDGQFPSFEKVQKTVKEFLL
ncbi:glycosyltransferase family 9 protein [Desulfurobacterium thermolithotrophum]|uniref:glycosyltransferase family 9 protein n=1 Tax=Desulfurobacterium thermolithotrophum TaxID=64160 RepID=UPI0013D20A94|nr:glycosyltransferase family 9 protein [Desulfurobacterium thermolithotrophum]